MSSTYVTEPLTNGKVIINTTLGPLDVELWPKEVPNAVRNFVQLCMEGYYDGCIFHRVIKDFIVQTGDPTGTGEGGESIWGKDFKKEFHSRLRFSHRGLLAMAGGPDGNQSQFFITLAPAPALQGKHTIFGKLTGNAIYNLLPINDFELDGERPSNPPRIINVEVLHNPFDDIIPRVKAQPVQVQEEKKVKPKRKKNFKLLSFGDEAEEEEKEADEIEVPTLVAAHLKPTPMMLEAEEKRARKRRKREAAQKNVVQETNDDDDDDEDDDEDDDNNNNNIDNQKDLEIAAAKERQEKLKEQEKQLKREIIIAQGGKVPDDDSNDNDRTASKHRSKIVPEGEYAIAATRDKYTQKARLDKKAREKAALAKFSAFTNKLRTTEVDAATTKNDEDYCKLHNKWKCNTCDPERDEEDDESSDDPAALFSHRLEFEKEAKHTDELFRNHDDDYSVYDPLDPESIKRQQQQLRNEARERSGKPRHDDRRGGGRHDNRRSGDYARSRTADRARRDQRGRDDTRRSYSSSSRR